MHLFSLGIARILFGSALGLSKTLGKNNLFFLHSIMVEIFFTTGYPILRTVRHIPSETIGGRTTSQRRNR